MSWPMLSGSQEYQKLHDLNKKQSTVLVVGAGFIGVEWAEAPEMGFGSQLFRDGKMVKCEMEISGNDQSRI